ncbi:MAG: DUF503 domain-containing protein [bacterium]
MIIGVFHIHVRISMAQSLKDKRGVLKGTLQRISKKYNVSIAEVDGHDRWQEATLGVSCVSNERRIIESSFRKILDDLEKVDGLELEAYDEEYF